jgi:hypothetical protein
MRYFLLKSNNLFGLERNKLTGVNGHFTSMKSGILCSWTIVPLRLRRKAQVHGILMARSLSFCGGRETGGGRVAALNADAIKFYTVHFTHKVEYFYGQMMKAADNSISGYGEIRRRCVCMCWIRAELAKQIPLLGTSFSQLASI